MKRMGQWRFSSTQC